MISLLLTIIVLSGFTAGAVIDVLLGWILAGWVVALAMALRSAGPGTPVVQVVGNRFG